MIVNRGIICSLCNANLFLPISSFNTSMGAHGPLIDGPDYTFLDGRPTPLRSGQRRRAQEQRDVAVCYFKNFI